MKTKSILAIALSALSFAVASAQSTPKEYFGATPELKVSGNELVDPNGKPVTLHGVMDTPNTYFNDNMWSNNYSYNDAAVAPCLAYFTQIFDAITDTNKGAYCNLFRLHLDPCWLSKGDSEDTMAEGFSRIADGTTSWGSTNWVYTDPNGTKVGGESNIAHFSEEKLRTYLQSLYIPIMKDAIAHGLYVVVRPPGVFPSLSKVDDYYNEYLMTVWDIISQNSYIQEHSGQISFELGNEPIIVQNSDGTYGGHMAAYFQPIVDKIRSNGFDGIIWLPGTGYQAFYCDFVEGLSYGFWKDKWITATGKAVIDPGNNMGYAVHCYPGWYNSDSNTQTNAEFIAQFENSVPVVNTNPIVITEIDWSPGCFQLDADGNKIDKGDGNYLTTNYGSWGTATTTSTTYSSVEMESEHIGFGNRYKALVDQHENISWTLEGTTQYINMKKYLADGTVEPSYLDDMVRDGYPNAYEASSGAAWEWYREYACGDRLPEYKKTVAEPFGNAKIVDDNKLCFQTPTFSGFIFDDLVGKKVKDIAELTVKTSDESTIGYRLDFRLKKSDGTLIGTDDYIAGSESEGTRYESVQVDRTYDIQKILAQYLDDDPDVEFENIRINTVVPYDKQEEAANLQLYIVFNGFDLLETHATAEPLSGTVDTDLTQEMFTTWDGYGADAQPLGATSHWLEVTNMAKPTNVWEQQVYYNFDTAIPAGTYNFTFTMKGDQAQDAALLVWGLFNDDNQWFGGGSWNATSDWTTYTGTWTFDKDLKELRFMLGNYEGTTFSLDKVKMTKDGTTYLDTDFEDGTVSGWAKPNGINGHTYNVAVAEQTNDIIKGTYDFGTTARGMFYGDGNVNGKNYADLSDYDYLRLTVTEGTPRLVFNRQSTDNSSSTYLEVASEGDYAKKDGDVWTINLSEVKKWNSYGFAHLNCIKAPWNTTAVITNATLVRGDNRAFYADYALHGAGYQEQSFINALSDANAAVIDATDMLNECPQTYTPSNPNCLFVQDYAQATLFDNTPNLVTKNGNAYTAQQITLQDGYNYRAPVNITVADATYTRDLTTEWGTVTIPFDIVAGQGTPELYKLESVTNDKMRFTSIEDGTAIPANTALVYRNTDKGTTTFSGQNIGKTIDGWNIQPIEGADGWYICQSVEAKVIDNVATDDILSAYDVYAINGDKFVHATKKLTTKPFRAFFLCQKTNNAVRTFSIVADEAEVTNITTPQTSATATQRDQYDATGRRITTPQRGITIIRMSDGTVHKVIR